MENTLSVLYLPSAIALGALHALEPGHAKTLTAAYLIGVKGTKRDAILLGLSVAFTHSIVVILLSAGALTFGREAFADNAMYWLQMTSGVFVILLGSWMLWRRLRRPIAPVVPVHVHGAPEPIRVNGTFSSGSLEIIQTPSGERMRYSAQNSGADLQVRVQIMRGDKIESLTLKNIPGDPLVFISDVAPAEPHEFKAILDLNAHGHQQTISFEMFEPEGHGDHGQSHDHGHAHDHGHGHGHDAHDNMSDDEHARAHAATLPDYVQRGERPTLGQILAFGAAGGLIPCPASVTVMLLALSIGKTGLGLMAVLGFSIGLAITLVGMGLLVVAGISKLSGGGRFVWLSSRAPAISAAMVILSGVFALFFAH